jgi:hypothetical protein
MANGGYAPGWKRAALPTRGGKRVSSQQRGDLLERTGIEPVTSGLQTRPERSR